MKRLYIVVEGQTELEFVREILSPYFREREIFAVTPICIHTSRYGRGGLVNYEHLKNDIKRLLCSERNDFIVSTFVDYFRCPELPDSEQYTLLTNHVARVEMMEQCIARDIHDSRFIPYIQLHEFEALLFASNRGFLAYFSDEQARQTGEIVQSYTNPEDINSSPESAPSKRLLVIKPEYFST